MCCYPGKKSLRETGKDVDLTVSHTSGWCFAFTSLLAFQLRVSASCSCQIPPNLPGGQGRGENSLSLLRTLWSYS